MDHGEYQPRVLELDLLAQRNAIRPAVSHSINDVRRVGVHSRIERDRHRENIPKDVENARDLGALGFVALCAVSVRLEDQGNRRQRGQTHIRAICIRDCRCNL